MLRVFLVFLIVLLFQTTIQLFGQDTKNDKKTGSQNDEVVADTLQIKNDSILIDDTGELSKKELKEQKKESKDIEKDAKKDDKKKSKDQDTEEKEVKKVKAATAIGAKLSLLGVGTELTLAPNERISIRFGGTYYNFNLQTILPGTDDVVFSQSFGGGAYLIADYQFIKWMHATAGLVYRATNQEVVSESDEGFSIGGISIPADIVGKVTYAIVNNSFGVYAGVGFGRTISFEKLIAFSLSLGTYYIPNSSLITISGEGLVSPTSNSDNVSTIEENVGYQNFYPFISVQVSIRLN